MTVYALGLFLVAYMASVVPPSDHWREKREVTEARYMDVGFTIAEVALEDDEVPFVPNDETRVKSALVIASIAAHESYLRADVMDCSVTGPRGALTTYQFELPRSEVCKSLYEDTKRAFVYARESFEECRRLPIGDRLALYTTGKCRRNRESRMRVLRAITYWTHHKDELEEAFQE